MPVSILLVDDDEQSRVMLSEALTGEGFLVREASEGDKASNIMRSGPHYNRHQTDTKTQRKRGEVL